MPQPNNTSTDYWAPGEWNIECSMCGRKMKSGDAVRNWQGQYRHEKCNEPRQPQDFVRGVKDDQTVPFSQPAKHKNFITACDLAGISAVADLATADCSIADRSTIPEGYVP